MQNNEELDRSESGSAEDIGDDLKINFGLNVKLERAKKKLRQSDLAKMLGVGQQYVSNVELGEISISINAMAKFASVLGRTVPDMLIPPTERMEK